MISPQTFGAAVQGVMFRAWGFSAGRLVTAIVVCSQFFPLLAARAEPAEIRWPEYRYYGGIGVAAVHHTGYVPGTLFSAQEYQPGFKLFAGTLLNERVLLEIAYHYLGEASFHEGTAARSREHSHAVAGSLLYVSRPVAEWLMPTAMPTHLLVRGGLAYKNIDHVATVGTFNEGVLSFVVGAGLEVRLSPRMFARVEYEFISTAVGGPRRRVSAVGGLFDATFGGTRRAINVMHTPLSLSVGMRF